MKKYAFLFSFITILSFHSKAQTSAWALDQAHSNLRFEVTHLMVSEIEGSIQITEATLSTPHEDFSDAKVTLSAAMNTIDTDNDGRDTHLKGPDFFDAEKYPAMTFTSESFKKVDDKKYTVTGPLAFHGVSKNVTLEVTATPGTQPWDNKAIVGFKVTGSIKRSDYNISPSTPSAALGDEVEIIANVIFSKS